MVSESTLKTVQTRTFTKESQMRTKEEKDEWQRQRDAQDTCGVLMSPDKQGMFFYSHSAAREGRLVRVKIVEVGYTHVRCQHEDRTKDTSFTVGNRGRGGRNWEVIDLELAEREIELFWNYGEAQKIAELEAIQKQHALIGKAISEAKQAAT